jgi:hypothetical protein
MNSKKAIVRPGAHALDKGLDLIEALAAESGGLSQKQIAERVGRSVGEIFRMPGVLEQRGYGRGQAIIAVASSTAVTGRTTNIRRSRPGDPGRSTIAKLFMADSRRRRHC